MIPKKIHYCWLGNEELPETYKKCMSTWKKVMPDYEIVLWDQNKFDVHSVPFVAEACAVKKWAFAADYIRLYALYTEGGIYLDTDVVIKKDLSEFLNYDFFTCVEYHYKREVKKEYKLEYFFENTNKLKNPIQCCVLQAAVIGGTGGHPFFKDCLEWYNKRHFISPNGKYHTHILAPDIYAMIAKKYGFSNKDEEQKLANNMIVFPSWYFNGDISKYTKETYALHWCEGAWRNKISFRKVYLKMTQIDFLRKLLRKKELKIKTLDDLINV
jgi:mannosyltransferase OCH1-like enzyme